MCVCVCVSMCVTYNYVYLYLYLYSHPCVWNIVYLWMCAHYVSFSIQLMTIFILMSVYSVCVVQHFEPYSSRSSSVQDGIYTLGKSHDYALHPVSQEFAQCCLWNGFGVCLIAVASRILWNAGQTTLVQYLWHTTRTWWRRWFSETRTDPRSSCGPLPTNRLPSFLRRRITSSE